MNLTRPMERLPRLFSSLLCLSLLLSINLVAQSRKKSSSKADPKKADVKKSSRSAKDARKDSRKDNRKEQLAKKASKKDERDRRESARSKRDKREDKKERVTAKERSRDRDDKQDKKDKNDKKDSKSRAERRAEARRDAAQRREAEQARRAAILAEIRRREQLAREARERKLAFERGLRTETHENILRDNPEGEDIAVRRTAVNALGNRAGTVVVIEAQTGKVLTIVNQEWAIKKSFKPCSTIKLVTGVAGLNENVIDVDGNTRSYSRMNLDVALARSNNPYFQRVGVNIGNKRIIDYAKDLGLGKKTGINADDETKGKLPHGNSNPRIYSHGDDFEVTPLQLAVMVSALSNGGKRIVPQVLRERSERASFRRDVKDVIETPRRSYEGVIPGMIGAAQYGTARRGVDASMGVAGKTGSCIFKGSWIGLFASVAPIENPKYSVVVITRGERERGKIAAWIAGRVYSTLRGQIR
ncbi:MAG: hypothetical protein LC730_04625, partial [Acidobacteria bacterium]|nr:hypothetical protein [Acidobacteriota bacterium]MCA1608729.1 hypothetical protein [Acidobacteriota bacterium]